MRNIRTLLGMSAAALSLALASGAIATETITYIYDAKGRLRKAERAGTVNNNVKSEYTYDDANNRTKSKLTGSGGSIITPTAYTTSSTYSSYTGLSGTGAGMRDGVYNLSSSVHGTNYETSPWIVMDLGSSQSVDKAVLVPIPFSFDGWGVSYLNGATLEKSADGMSWTSVGTVTSTTEGVPVQVTVGSSTRYLRVKISNNYLGVGDFYATAP